MPAHGAWTPIFVGLVAAGCVAPPPGPGAVRPGIDVLLTDSSALLAGRRVGLLTNQSGVDAHGVDDLTRLRQAGVEVTTLFSPEHGPRGRLDQENIEHGVDSATGLPLFSLYGETRRVTPPMLADVDVLVIDLQDIGARPYTYVSTALLALEGAAEVGVPVVVLDRPNPVGGVLVQGPILDTALASFIGMLPVPLRHGMTLGELMRMGRELRGAGGDLVVVPADGWHRTAWYDHTGLPWIPPSPNMPDLESAAHYPGLVMLEGTNLSVGRGTAVAFQVVGAPWLDAARVAAALAGTVAGAEIADTVVTPRAPTDAKYDGVAVPALRLRVRDRDRYDPVATAVRVLWAVREAHPDSLVLRANRFDQLAGTTAIRAGLEGGRTADEVIGAWTADLRAFAARREAWLLYAPELP